MCDDDLDDYMEKRIIWFNKEDMIDGEKLMKKISKIYFTEMVYGVCFVLTEDLPIETVERIFDGKKDRKNVLDKLSDYCGNDCEKDSCYKCYIDELIEYLCEE